MSNFRPLMIGSTSWTRPWAQIVGAGSSTEWTRGARALAPSGDDAGEFLAVRAGQCRQRLVDGASSVAAIGVGHRDDDGKFAALGRGQRRQRIVGRSGRPTAIAAGHRNHKPEPGLGRHGRQRQLGRGAAFAGAVAIVRRDQHRSESAGHARHRIADLARCAAALARHDKGLNQGMRPTARVQRLQRFPDRAATAFVGTGVSEGRHKGLAEIARAAAVRGRHGLVEVVRVR